MKARWLELSLVGLIGLFWGLNWPVVKLILAEWPPWTLRGISFAFATAGLIGLAVLQGDRLMPKRSDLVLLVTSGLLTVLAFNILVAYGQLLTSTSNATIIAFTMPVWALVLSVVLLGEAVTPRKITSLALGVAGLAVLVGENLVEFAATPAGPIVVLAGAVAWALGTVLLKLRDWSIPPLSRAAWMLGCSAPLALLGAAILEWPHGIPDLSYQGMALLGFHILFPMIFCYGVWVILVARLPASVAAIGTLLIPIVGVTSSAIWLGEELGWQKIVALALVLASIALTFMRWRKRAQ